MRPFKQYRQKMKGGARAANTKNVMNIPSAPEVVPVTKARQLWKHLQALLRRRVPAATKKTSTTDGQSGMSSPLPLSSSLSTKHLGAAAVALNESVVETATCPVQSRVLESGSDTDSFEQISIPTTQLGHAAESHHPPSVAENPSRPAYIPLEEQIPVATTQPGDAANLHHPTSVAENSSSPPYVPLQCLVPLENHDGQSSTARFQDFSGSLPGFSALSVPWNSTQAHATFHQAWTREQLLAELKSIKRNLSRTSPTTSSLITPSTRKLLKSYHRHNRQKRRLSTIFEESDSEVESNTSTPNALTSDNAMAIETASWEGECPEENEPSPPEEFREPLRREDQKPILMSVPMTRCPSPIHLEPEGRDPVSILSSLFGIFATDAS